MRASRTALSASPLTSSSVMRVLGRGGPNKSMRSNLNIRISSCMSASGLWEVRRSLPSARYRVHQTVVRNTTEAEREAFPALLMFKPR
jgi:hypothetical protein